MKIIICGLPGTGKTNLAKTIFEEYKFNIVSDWDIFQKFNIDIKPFENKKTISENYSKLLLDYINDKNDNVVVDLEYSISPSDFIKYNDYNNTQIIYLGFISLDEKTLFALFRNSDSNKKYTDNELMLQIKFYKDMSILYKEQCDKNGLKFFDINKDRKEIQKEILNYLDIRRKINEWS